MDPTKDKTLEELLDGIKFDDDHMYGYEAGRVEPGYGAVPLGHGSDTITLSGSFDSNTVIGGGYSYSALGTNFPNVSITGPYTVNSVTGVSANPWSFNPSPKLKLDGEGADIEVNGLSLIKMLQEIQSRLNILQPNTALEAEWNELFELGKKYRELEQHIKDKQATWDRLKAMPTPVIE